MLLFIVNFAVLSGQTILPYRVLSDAELRAAFASMDANNDGIVVMSEVTDSLRSSPPGSVNASQWMARMDADRDGRVTFEEYRTRIRAYEAQRGAS